MNAEKSLQLARRFIELPLEKRRVFLEMLGKEGIDFSQLPIPAAVAAEDRAVPSYAQRRMWFLWQMDSQSGAYNLPMAVRLRGPVQIEALRQAFDDLVARHETLRTVFLHQADDSLVQAPLARAIEVETLDLSALPEAEREARVREEATLQSEHAFDLERGPLLRVRLVRLAVEEHVLLLTLHHIVADGWSMSVLIDEFRRFYLARSQGRQADLPALPIQYSDYALWQRRWLEAGEQQRQLDYWLAHLGQEHPLIELPADRPRPLLPSYDGRRVELTLDGELAGQLKALARQHNMTLFMVLLGAFAMLLQRYTGQDELRIGVPIANRNRNETEGLIGFFVNTQVLRLAFDGQVSAAQVLDQVRQAALGAQAHQDLPFEQLVEALRLERSLSHNPLFQVMYNHQADVADITTLSLDGGLSLDVLDWQSRNTQFDLSLDTHEKAGVLHATFTYATDLFDAPRIERLAGHWQALLGALVEDAGRRVGDLPLLACDERQRLLEQWGNAAAEYPSELCVHQLFAQCVERTPQAPALLFETRQLSYRELDERANRLARHLISLGVGPEVLVGVALERGLDMVVAILAVLKAGGGYVPLDPQYPRDRLLCMIEDSGSRLLLSQASLRETLAVAGVRTVCLDQDQAWAGQDASPLANRSHPDNLAYVMFTSGSTGRPKGVGISHRALSRHAHVSLAFFGLSSRDRVLQFATFNFDGFVEQLYPALICGASVVLRGNTIWDSETFYQQLVSQHISVVDLTTAYWNMLAKEFAAIGPRDYAALRQVHSGGEAMPPEGLLAWRKAGLGHVRLLNTYGPTEATVTATTLDCGAYVRGERAIPLTLPIGRALPGRRLYVLDRNGGLAPTGVTGELVIGGELLARGYFGRPGLTAERFLPDPNGAPGARQYRTGDLARFNDEGILDYTGRIDHQVKIRGFRIELGEIEARLLEHEGVGDASVQALPGVSGLQLVGYVVPADTRLLDDPEAAALGREAWREALQACLPEYMVPAQWVLLAKLPLSPNGKLDRKALPAPDAQQRQLGAEPQGPVESSIAAIWQALLNVEQVGRDDNFFELGGDSIVSIQVVSRARQVGLGLSPRDLFLHQTVRSLAQAARQSTALAIEQGPLSGPLSLLPIQLDFLRRELPDAHHWNQAVLLKSTAMLQDAPLRGALQALWRHHDALRARVRRADAGWACEMGGVEQAPDDLLWQVTVSDVAALPALYTQAQASLVLEQGPLLRALLATLPDGSQRLLLAVHHLVVDGVSWRILLEDLLSAYQQLCDGRQPQLPAKTSAFATWSARLVEQAGSPQRLAELPYWQAQLAAVRDLPCERPQGSLASRHAQVLRSRFDTRLTQQLLQQANAAYRTGVNDLLLAALAWVVRDWSAQADCVVALEGHGRESLFDDLDLTRTVGWFTSQYPLRLSAAASLGETLKQVKEQLRGVPGKGLGYGLLRQYGDGALRALPEPRITFNYLGQFDASFDEHALLRPALEPAGAEQSEDAPLDNWLSVEGQVYGGELEMRWTFSQAMFDSATVEHLVAAYQRALGDLLAHCCDPRTAGVTPSDFPLANLDQASLDGLPLPAALIEDIYPLGPMQQGMLFHALHTPGQGTYINQLVVDIDGLDVPRFQAAWQALIDAHPVLRSGFVWQQAGVVPLQLVQRQVALDFVEHDWRGKDTAQALDAFAAQDRQCDFDLQRPGLLRLALIRTDEQRHRLLFTHHHILMDGWSCAQLFGQVLQAYAGEPPVVVGRFSDYVQWLAERDGAATEAFWRAQLAPLDGPTLLQPLLGASLDDSTAHRIHHSTLDAGLSQRLTQFARQQKITLNTLFQGAWALLLQRYSGSDSVVFGCTVAGRPAELVGIEEQLGLFINTLPLVVSARAEQPLGAWLQALQAQGLALRDHEHTPLYEVQGWAGRSGEALFDNILVFENFPVAQALAQGAVPGLVFGEVTQHDQTSYPLTLGVTLGEQLQLHYNHALDAFSPAAIARIDGHLLQLLAQICTSAERLLGELTIGDAQERALLRTLNDTAVDYPLDRSIQQLIEAQVDRTPEAEALVFGDTRLSYAQLDARANQLARHLIAQGVGPDVLVGIAAERSIEMVVGLLAILKAGGAYVPLDPEYPAERLSYMFEDSGIQLLLTQSHLHLPLPEGLTVLHLDTLQLEGNDSSRPLVAVSPENLAYVIYTSGSTGKPKGAGNRHSALVNRLCWMQQAYGLDGSDTVLQKTPFSFDVSVWEFFWPLMTGARLAVAGPGDHRDPSRLVELINQHQVSTLHFVPSMLQVFLQDEQVASCTSLKRIVCSGEALQVDAQQGVFAKLPNAGLFNLYGPTEAAIDVTHWTCRDEGRDTVPIGQPIANLATYVLDGNLEPVPVGVVGELYLGGEGLARGYHRRPGLTAERFVTSPFGDGARLYRTGDLASQRVDGVIEYRGRIDHQVKIRGLRIELGEIEARLLEQDGVREAAVIARGAQLVAYVVPVAAGTDLVDNLKAALKASLPDYMVPAHFVLLEALPLSANGKLERRALPDPQAGAGAAAYRAPGSELECQLAGFWQEVLKVERVGLDDDFFELGGHSLQLIMLLARLRGALGIELAINDFYALRTLHQLAAHVQAVMADNDPSDELDLIFGALDELEEHNA